MHWVGLDWIDSCLCFYAARSAAQVQATPLPRFPRTTERSIAPGALSDHDLDDPMQPCQNQVFGGQWAWAWAWPLPLPLARPHVRARMMRMHLFVHVLGQGERQSRASNGSRDGRHHPLPGRGASDQGSLGGCSWVVPMARAGCTAFAGRQAGEQPGAHLHPDRETRAAANGLA